MSSAILGPAALAIVATTIALWARAVRRLSIPDDRTAYIIGCAIGGAVAVATLLLSHSGDSGRFPAWLALFPAGFFLFTVAISRQKPGANAIRVGDDIPRFTATDEHGAVFDSLSLAGHLVLIKFFRAHW